MWLDSYDRRTRIEEAVAAAGQRFAGYLVTESLYEDYGTTPHATPRTWPNGTRSPGVLTVSLIHRPAGLDYETWIERWHGIQSPLSGAPSRAAAMSATKSSVPSPLAHPRSTAS